LTFGQSERTLRWMRTTYVDAQVAACTATRLADDNPSAEPVEGLCGKKIVLSVAGADVSAESLCLAHWGVRHGFQAVKPPVVSES
jgi:hypothetical protein